MAGCYVIPSEILSVRPSVSAPTILLPATPPTVLGQSFSNFTAAFMIVWRYAYCFFRILKLFFYHIFCIFNLDFFQALILQKCIGSMYLVHATTFSGRSSWNFTHAFRLVWRYAYLASVAQLDAPSDWRPEGRGFNPRRSRQHSFVEIDHEIFSTVILSLPLIQEGAVVSFWRKNVHDTG